MIPFDYAARNCLRSPSRLIQLIIGSALVVLLVCFAAAFNQGMHQVMQASGDAQNVIILGSGSEESVERSEVASKSEGIIEASISGLHQELGISAVSGEVYYNGLIKLQNNDYQCIFRGVTERALQVHRQVRLIDGHWPGPNEILVGQRAYQNLGVQATDLAIGQEIYFEHQTFTISGHFIAPGTVLESEIWMPRQDLMTATQRETLSCVIIRLGQAEFGDVEYFTSTRLDLELVAIAEEEYYEQLAGFYKPISFMTWATAILIALGAVLGGINTLYAAFAARQREMGTLQAIGYSRLSIFFSLLQESFIAVLLGTIVAQLIGLLLIHGWHISFASGVFSLQWQADILMLGLVVGIALALCGTLAPAWRCLAPPLQESLRGLS